MQFLHPEFLWGLLAISVPVIIHLLQLRRPQRVAFSNTAFIRAVELTTVRRRRLQELLVLAARVAAILLLVLLFCQPFIPARQKMVSGTGQVVTVLVDNSPSMQVPNKQQSSLLKQAVDEAQVLAKTYGSAERFQLLTKDRKIGDEIAYKTKLLGIESAFGKNAWDNANSYQEIARNTVQPLYIFSDFQKGEASNTFLKSLPTNREVVLAPQVGRSVGNVYVDSVWLDDAFVRTRVNVSLHLRLRNGGSESVTDCPIKVMLGQRQVAAFRVSIEAGKITATVVQVQLPDAKLALGRIITADAPVTFDNTYYFTLQPAAAIQVVEIGPVPLAQQAYENEPLFAYSFARPQELNFSKLQQANVVLVNGLAQIDSGLRQVLVQITKRGGSVVVIPASKLLSHESYHQLFRDLGLGGEQWLGATGAPVLQEVAMPNRNTPFFKDVFGAQPRQVVMPQAAPVLSWGRNGTDVLRLRDGDSYLTQFESGSGKVFVFAAPFDRAYSDFAAHALFVPVMYRLAMLSYYHNQQLAYRINTPTVTLAVPRLGSKQPAVQEGANIRLVKDSAVFVLAQRLQGADMQVSIPSEMSEPGFYEVQQQGKQVTMLAFNADQHESELATYSAAELRKLIGPSRPNVRVLDDEQPEAIAHYRAEQTGQPLWRYCLVLALICLLAEGMLLRFGRPKAAPRPVVMA